MVLPKYLDLQRNRDGANKQSKYFNFRQWPIWIAEINRLTSSTIYV